MDETGTCEQKVDGTKRGKWRSPATVAIAGGLIAVTIGVSAVAIASNPPSQGTSEPRQQQTVSEADLGALTLDDLASQLEELELVLEITPAGDHVGTLDEGVPHGDGAIGEETDPFTGMTDAQIDALSDDEFEAMLGEAGWALDDPWDVGDPNDGDAGHDEFDDETPLATFSVSGDRLEAVDATPALAGEAQAIWERFTDLIPADQRQMVVGFELLSEDFGGAFVYATDEDPTKWVLGVGLGMGDELDSVLVHEFGHLLTLQASQVPPGGNEPACTTYFTGEGCALTSSTFNRFVERFWPDTMIEETARIEERGDWDAADAFYEEHKDEFVTDYATANPGEDLAETFAVFVLDDRPTGNTVADEKIRFLWDDPAMVALRDQIRANLV